MTAHDTSPAFWGNSEKVFHQIKVSVEIVHGAWVADIQQRVLGWIRSSTTDKIVGLQISLERTSESATMYVCVRYAH